MNRRRQFGLFLVATAMWAFLSSYLEYQGFEYLTFAMISAVISVVSCILSVISAVRLTMSTELLTAAFLIVGAPFAVSALLTMAGTSPNVHGVAILSFILNLLISLVGGVVLLIKAAVRYSKAARSRTGA